MTSLLAMYGEGVARGVNFICYSGCVFALAVMLDCWLHGTRPDLIRKCLWTMLIFAIILTLFPGPDFFKTLAGRP